MKIHKIKNDISKTYQIGDYKIEFDFKSWTWLVINLWGFGIYSDLSLSKCKKVAKDQTSNPYDHPRKDNPNTRIQGAN